MEGVRWGVRFGANLFHRKRENGIHLLGFVVMSGGQWHQDYHHGLRSKVCFSVFNVTESRGRSEMKLAAFVEAHSGMPDVAREKGEIEIYQFSKFASRVLEGRTGGGLV